MAGRFHRSLGIAASEVIGEKALLVFNCSLRLAVVSFPWPSLPYLIIVV